jgi:methyl-accepting chemotaxis protein
MKNWTIARRIILGFTAVILTALALGTFAYTRLVTIKHGTTEIARQAVPGLLAISGIESLARQNYSATLKYTAAKSAEERARLMSTIQANIARINGLTNDYAATISQAQDAELLAAMLKARAAYVPAFKAVCQMIDDGKAAEAAAYFQAQVEPASASFMAAIEAAVTREKETTSLATSRIDDSTRSAQNGILTGLATALAAAVIMSLVIILAINRVLTTVATTLDQGAGELDRKSVV